MMYIAPSGEGRNSKSAHSSGASRTPDLCACQSHGLLRGDLRRDRGLAKIAGKTKRTADEQLTTGPPGGRRNRPGQEITPAPPRSSTGASIGPATEPRKSLAICCSGLANRQISPALAPI